MISKAMRLVLLFSVFLTASLLARDPLVQRIGHTDPNKYTRSRSHGSAGDMACELLVPPTAMNVNLNFVHRCQIMPGGGVGHHFHNTNEEMFIVFDGEAEFTIDGRGMHIGEPFRDVSVILTGNPQMVLAGRAGEGDDDDS